MINVNYASGNTIIDDIDLNDFIRVLKEFYNTEDLEYIKLQLKQDLKSVDRIKEFLEYSNFEFEEMLINLSQIYSDLFGKRMVKVLRAIKDNFIK